MVVFVVLGLEIVLWFVVPVVWVLVVMLVGVPVPVSVAVLVAGV